MGELGNRLRETREARGLTVEDAERDTRISRRYLQALEDEKFETIPAPVYARGFLRSYSQYLGLNPQEMLDLFPREDGPDAPAAKGTLKPSKETPLPPQSRSRPTWSRPNAGRPGARAPRVPERFPGSGGIPVSTRPVTPGEPTIGVDIGLPIPARRLEQDSAAATRTAVILGIAAIAIALILGIAWLISRSGDSSANAGGGAPGTAATSNTATSEAESTATTGPAVQRGIVPDVIGLSSEQAAAIVEAAGYEVVPLTANSPNVTRGNVLDQSPAPGTQLSEGQKVWITVSDGP